MGSEQEREKREGREGEKGEAKEGWRIGESVGESVGGDAPQSPKNANARSCNMFTPHTSTKTKIKNNNKTMI